MPKNFSIVMLGRLRSFVNPLRSLASGDREAWQSFESATGWLLFSRAVDLQEALTSIIGVADAAAAWAEGLGDDSPPPILEVAGQLSGLREAVRSFQTTAAVGLGIADRPDLLGELGIDLIELLVLNHLIRREPEVYASLYALGLIRRMFRSEIVVGSVILRRGGVRPHLMLSLVPDLLEDPLGYIIKLYVPKRDPFDDDAARLFAGALTERLSPAVLLTGGLVQHHGNTLPSQILPTPSILFGREMTAAEEDSYRRLFRTSTFQWPIRTPVPAIFGFRVEALPEGVRGGSGLMGPGADVALFGAISFERSIDRYSYSGSVAAEVDVLGISPGGEIVFNSTSPPSVEARLSFGISEPFSLTFKEGITFTIARILLDASFSVGSGLLDVGLGIGLEGMKLGFEPSSGDGFLGKLFCRQPLLIEADFSLSWTRSKGLQADGGLDLSYRIPVNKALGPAFLRYLDLSLQVNHDHAGKRIPLLTSAGIGADLALGPIFVSIEGVGLSVAVAGPSAGGAAGFGEIALTDDLGLQLGIRAPTGAGFAIDISPAFSGGGFFEVTDLDDGSRKYAGAAAFTLMQGTMALAAFGIVVAGPHRFSMLVSITAAFNPIQLGYGFTLNGVGGMLGVNRTIDDVALGEGARNGQLDSILFPKDAAKDAARILQNLDTFFPEHENSFVFGAMVSIGYQTFLVVNLGIILTFPEPLVFTLVGQIHVNLPGQAPSNGAEGGSTASASAPAPAAAPAPAGAAPSTEMPPLALLTLHLDFAGSLNLTEKRLSFDAGLHDSFITGFAIAGQMAMRLRFGDKPEFLMAFGGFNPRFERPADFPELKRLSISFGFSEAVKLGCYAYFALTANTLQFGCSAELLIKVWEIEITGNMNFDAMICFKPFHLTVDAGISVSIAVAGMDLLAGSAAVMLSGPAPRWHIEGVASYTILGVEHKKEFSKDFGKTFQDPEAKRVNVAKLLAAELALPTSLSVGPGRLKLGPMEKSSTRYAACDADWELAQRVAPLKQKLDKLGTAVIVGASGPFEISAPANIRVKSLPGQFALGQFVERSLDTQLNFPSFEEASAGVQSIPVSLPDGKVELPADEFEVLLLGEGSVPAALASASSTKNQSTSPDFFQKRSRQRRSLGRFSLPEAA